jgi:hypothetical protein
MVWVAKRMLHAGHLVETGFLEVISGIPRVAKAMEDLPVEQLRPEQSRAAIAAHYRIATSLNQIVTL